MVWVKINVLCFMCFAIFHDIQTETTQDEIAGDQLKQIFKAQIWKKILKKSVLFDGYKKINVSEFLSNEFEFSQENINKTALVYLYTAFKCHCVDSMKYLHTFMYDFYNVNSKNDKMYFRQNVDLQLIINDHDEINEYLFSI